MSPRACRGLLSLVVIVQGMLLAPSTSAQFADFSATPSSGPEALSVQFESQVDGSWYSWDFGDGQQLVGAVPDPLHVYEVPGVYTVSSLVFGPVGLGSSTKVDLIEVLPAAMRPAFTAQGTSGVAALSVSFTDLTAGDEPDSWTWDFGDAQGSTEQHPSHVYLVPGVYDVSLTVTRATAIETISHAALVHAQSPEVMLPTFAAMPTVGAAPLQVSFVGEVGGEQADSYTWHFGDGQTSSEQSPVHSYAEPGEYTVSFSTQQGSLSEGVLAHALVRVTPSTFDLEPAQFLQATNGLQHVRIGDVTGDGRPDIVAAGDDLVTLLQQGDGSFSAPIVTSLPAVALDLDLADLNGDGRADAVLRVAGSSGIDECFARTADGAGGWRVSWSHDQKAADLALADFDEDGVLNLLMAADYELPIGGPGDLRLGFGDGGGGFGELPATGLIGNTAKELEIADLDVDGHADILWMYAPFDEFSYGFGMRVALGDGKGRFIKACETYFPSAFDDPGYGASAAGDVTGDGIPDWVAVLSGGCAVETHTLLISPTLDGCPDVPDACAPGLSSTQVPLRMLVTNLDGLGPDDLITLGHMAHPTPVDHLLRVRLAGGDGGLGIERVYDPGLPARDVAVGDLDLDGVPDLALVGGFGSEFVSVLRNLSAAAGFAPLGGAVVGGAGSPVLTGEGTLLPDSDVRLVLSDGAPGVPVTLVVGLSPVLTPFHGGLLVPSPDVLLAGLMTDAAGGLQVSSRWPASLGPGFSLWFQMWLADASATSGLAASNGLKATAPLP